MHFEIQRKLKLNIVTKNQSNAMWQSVIFLLFFVNHVTFRFCCLRGRPPTLCLTWLTRLTPSFYR